MGERAVRMTTKWPENYSTLIEKTWRWDLQSHFREIINRRAAIVLSWSYLQFGRQSHVNVGDTSLNCFDLLLISDSLHLQIVLLTKNSRYVHCFKNSTNGMKTVNSFKKKQIMHDLPTLRLFNFFHTPASKTQSLILFEDTIFICIDEANLVSSV